MTLAGEQCWKVLNGPIVSGEGFNLRMAARCGNRKLSQRKGSLYWTVVVFAAVEA